MSEQKQTAPVQTASKLVAQKPAPTLTVAPVIPVDKPAEKAEAPVLVTKAPLVTYTEEEVNAKILRIREHLSQFVGKEGFNPFIWDKNKLEPLIARSEFAKIMALSDTPDCSNHAIEHLANPHLAKSKIGFKPIKPVLPEAQLDPRLAQLTTVPVRQQPVVAKGS